PVFSPEGHRLLVPSKDGTVRVWDASTGALLVRSIASEATIQCAEFSPDGRFIVIGVGTADYGWAQVYESETGRPIGSKMRHESLIYFARFDHEGNRVLTATWDNTARVWDATTGQPLTPPLRHRDSVQDASFSSEESRVVTASWDKTARVWDAITGDPLTPS